MTVIFGIMKVLSFNQLGNPMKKSKLLWLLAVIFVTSGFLLLLNSHSVHAADGLMNIVEEGGLRDVGAKAYSSTINSVLDPRVMIARVITKLLGFLGIIMVGLVMYSGWQYMSAEGDKTKLDAAKKRIQNATIGIVIIVSAYAITNFIIECSGFVTDRGILTNMMCS